MWDIFFVSMMPSRPTLPHHQFSWVEKIPFLPCATCRFTWSRELWEMSKGSRGYQRLLNQLLHCKGYIKAFQFCIVCQTLIRQTIRRSSPQYSVFFSPRYSVFFFLSPIFCFLSPIFCFFSSAQYSVCWATQQAVISCAHKNFQPMAIWCVMKLFQWLENGWCFLSRSSCDFFYFFTYTFPLNFDLLLA